MLLNKLISPIKNNRKDDVKGSIVLEAALVMPVFILVIFFFIYMIQMTLLINQMQMAVSNTVRQVSTNIYPVALAVSAYNERDSSGASASEASGEQVNANGSKRSIPQLSLTSLADEYASSFPAPISRWIKDAAAKGDEPLNDFKNTVAESVLDPVIKPLIHPFLEGTLLNEDRLHVSRIVIPNLKTGATPYFGLEISYELPIKVPFTGKRIILQAKAEERLWIGDTGELDQGNDQNGDSVGEAAVILSKPDPAYAGHRASVTAQAAPGTKLKMTVYYKSGVSQAKYLGEAIADEDGIVEWNWLVGGNTTLGIWTFVIETEEGITTTSVFHVEKK